MANDDWRLRLVRAWRAWRDRQARVSVLVLGDSHVRVFEHWWFIWALPQVRWRITYVPGATATGLYNRGSQTQTHARFGASLGQEAADWVVLNLGEVDTGYTLWARAQRRQQEIDAVLDEAVERYVRYIGELVVGSSSRPPGSTPAPTHHHRPRLIVIGAPLPTLPDDFIPSDHVGSTRKAVPLTQRQRTALTLAFNERVAQACRAMGVPHLDDRECSLSPTTGTVRPQWTRADAPDHHYDRKTYARWLARALAPLLKDRTAP